MVALESEEVLLYQVFWNRMIIAPDPIYRAQNTLSFGYSSPFMYNPKIPSIKGEQKHTTAKNMAGLT